MIGLYGNLSGNLFSLFVPTQYQTLIPRLYVQLPSNELHSATCMDLKSYVNISKPCNRLRCLHCNYTSQYKSTGIGSWKFLALKSSLARTHAWAHCVYENLDAMHAIKCTTPTAPIPSHPSCYSGVSLEMRLYAKPLY